MRCGQRWCGRRWRRDRLTFVARQEPARALDATLAIRRAKGRECLCELRDVGVPMVGVLLHAPTITCSSASGTSCAVRDRDRLAVKHAIDDLGEVPLKTGSFVKSSWRSHEGPDVGSRIDELGERNCSGDMYRGEPKKAFSPGQGCLSFTARHLGDAEIEHFDDRKGTRAGSKKRSPA